MKKAKMLERKWVLSILVGRRGWAHDGVDKGIELLHLKKGGDMEKDRCGGERDEIWADGWMSTGVVICFEQLEGG